MGDGALIVEIIAGRLAVAIVCIPLTKRFVIFYCVLFCVFCELYLSFGLLCQKTNNTNNNLLCSKNSI